MTRGEAATVAIGSDSRRADLVVAAAALFRERGVNGAGVDDIAGSVGLSGPAVYRYFDGKQALLEAVVSTFAEQVGELTSETTAPDGVDLRRAVRVLLLQRDALAVCLRQSAHLSSAARDHEGLRAGARAWADVVARHGSGSAELELRGRAAVGCVVALSFGRDGTERLTDLAVDCVRRVLDVRLTPGRDMPRGGGDLSPRPQTLRAFRRESILVRAATLFRTNGFNGVSLADIGAAVGITGSAVSRQFQTKEQLLVELFTRTGERLASAIFAAIERSPDAATAVVEIVRAYAGMAIDNRDLFLLDMHDKHHLPPAVRRRRNRNQRVYVDELTHLMHVADPSVEPAEARLRARAAFAAVNEAIVSDTVMCRARLQEDLTRLGLAVVGGGHRVGDDPG